MKRCFRICLVVAVMLFAVGHLGAETEKKEVFSLYNGNALEYIDLLKRFSDEEYAITYNDGGLILYTKNIMYEGQIYLEREYLQNVLEKWMEWEKLASKKKKKIEKTIPGSETNVVVKFTSGKTYTDNSVPLSFTFFSQSEKEHQLVLELGEATALMNQFMTYNMDNLYFEKDEVKRLVSAISEKSIKRARAQNKKKEEDEALFR